MANGSNIMSEGFGALGGRLAIAAALLLAACDTSDRTDTAGIEFAGRVAIGNGREMYVECRGSGSPTVVLVSGLDAAADLWNREEQPSPKAFPEVSGHNMMIDQPQLVTDSIREVVDAVRNGKSRLSD